MSFYDWSAYQTPGAGPGPGTTSSGQYVAPTPPAGLASYATHPYAFPVSAQDVTVPGGAARSEPALLPDQLAGVPAGMLSGVGADPGPNISAQWYTSQLPTGPLQNLSQQQQQQQQQQRRLQRRPSFADEYVHPVIDLATGSRFSQLLEAKLGLDQAHAQQQQQQQPLSSPFDFLPSQQNTTASLEPSYPVNLPDISTASQLAIEAALRDFSQVHIPPDLVAPPLPDEIWKFDTMQGAYSLCGITGYGLAEPPVVFQIQQMPVDLPPRAQQAQADQMARIPSTHSPASLQPMSGLLAPASMSNGPSPATTPSLAPHPPVPSVPSFSALPPSLSLHHQQGLLPQATPLSVHNPPIPPSHLPNYPPPPPQPALRNMPNGDWAREMLQDPPSIRTGPIPSVLQDWPYHVPSLQPPDPSVHLLPPSPGRPGSISPTKQGKSPEQASSAGDRSHHSSTPVPPGNDTKSPDPKIVIACHMCRARKLKCDGARPKCHHCTRRNEPVCQYDTVLRRRGPGKKTKQSALEASKDVGSAQVGDERSAHVGKKRPRVSNSADRGTEDHKRAGRGAQSSGIESNPFNGHNVNGPVRLQ